MTINTASYLRNHADINEQKYKNFHNKQLTPTTNRLEQLILSKSKNPIVILSHLADSDGFNFQAAQKLGIEAMLKATGSKRKVPSERYMTFSSDPKEENHIGNIIKKFGRGDYIIGDMPTLDPQLIDTNLVDSVTIIDHHPIRHNFPSNMLVCNPWVSEINGSEEFSAAITGANLVAMTYEKLLKNPSLTKSQLDGLSKIEHIINRSLICGAAGAQADMQEAKRGNLATYRYLLEKEYRTKDTQKNKKTTLIKRINTPFFGYATKEIGKVIAQTTPNFHFEHRVATKQELEKFLRETYKKSYSKTQKAVDEISKEFDVAFIRKREEKGALSIALNTDYLNSIEEDKVYKLNTIFKEIFGTNCAKKGPTEKGTRFIPETNIPASDFSYDEHYIIKNDDRLTFAKDLCCQIGLKSSELTLSEMHIDQIKEVNHMYRRNVLAFGDPDKKERAWAQSELSKPQHLINYKLNFGPENITIEELANFTTAMSKQRVGNKLIRLMSLIDASTGKETDEMKELKESLKITFKDYKENLYNLLQGFEPVYTSKEKMSQPQSNVFYANVDFLAPILIGDITLPSVNGVISGIACNSRNLPEKRSILYTGCTVTDRSGNEYYKISGRATSGPFAEGIIINKFMQRWGGGGHASAAACTIPKNKLEYFLDDLSKFNLFGG